MNAPDEEKPNLRRSLYEGLKKHWVWNTIILFLPSIWFPAIINLCGNVLHMTSEDGKKTNLTLFGIVVTGIVYVLVLAILLWNSRCANKEDDKHQKEIESIQSSYSQLNYILSCVHSICDNQFDMLKNTFKTSINCTDPSKQIEIILQKISDCLADVSKMDSKKINVALAYKISNGPEDWCWAQYSRTDGGLPLPELKGNCGTTFYQIFSGNREFVFYNSKIDAEKESHYVFDAKDKSYRNSGSIVCKKINVATPEKTYVEAILSITTYGKKFVPDDNEKLIEVVESNIRDIILPEFELRIQIELAQFCLQKLQCEKAS
jgi:hypothetical protein